MSFLGGGGRRVICNQRGSVTASVDGRLTVHTVN